MKSERLGNIISIHKGKKVKESVKSANSLRYIQIEDLRNDSNLKFTEELDKAVACIENDILIAWDGANAGTVGFGLNGAIGSTIAKLSATSNFFTPFVGRFLQSKSIDLREKCTGATIPHISKSYLTGLQIPLPPLSEQKRIAAILDKADALRQKNKQLLATYDKLLQATFLDMFGDPVINPKGWEKKKLGENIEKIQIGPFGSQLHKSDYIESGISLINPTNIFENKINLKQSVKISEEKYLYLPQYHLQMGDVIMARRGDLSKVALVDSKDSQLFCGTGSLFIRFNSNINKVFISTLLAHETTTKYLENEAVGVTMPNLNKGIIANIPLYVPPLSIQNQFAQIVENIEAQKAKIKQSLQESEDLFGALVQKAFEGEL